MVPSNCMATEQQLERTSNTKVMAGEPNRQYSSHPVYVGMTESERKLIVDHDDFMWFVSITPGQQRSELMARACGSPWHTQAPTVAYEG